MQGREFCFHTRGKKSDIFKSTPPVYEDGKSTQRTAWRWGSWLTGRRNAHYQEEE